MSKLLIKYPLDQCALYKCQGTKKLERLLFLETGSLKNIQNVIRYSKFYQDKKGTNEKREINAPGVEIKHVQSRILRLLQRIERPNWLISGEKGKSYIDNGKAHQQGKYALTVDIKKFYDNCKRDYVYRFFKERLLTSSDVACVMTDIVTYQNGIPTGCPTSQLIAYYAYQDMFQNISEIAEKNSCVFTVYVDDMTLSSLTPFNPKLLTREIDLALRKFGHKLKYPKVKYFSRNLPKSITGTIVSANNELLVPNKLREKIVANFKAIKPYLKNESISNETQQTINTLKGQVQSAENIQLKIFPEIKRLTKGVNTKGNKKQVKYRSRKKVVIEGKLRIE